jgi:hypothetical protein
MGAHGRFDAVARNDDSERRVAQAGGVALLAVVGLVATALVARARRSG